MNGIWFPDSVYDIGLISSRVAPCVPYIDTAPYPGGTVPDGYVLPVVTMGAVYVDGPLPLASGCIDSEDSACPSRVIVSVQNVVMLMTGC